MDEFISSQKGYWSMLDISAMGHIAKVYQAKDLENVASYFYLMYDEMPVDWLIWYWRMIKGTGNVHLVVPAASLFQHKGLRSSLKEKEWIRNTSYDRYFDLYDHKYNGLNPAAEVSSSIASNLGSPQDAYKGGSGYFWGKTVHTNDHVTVKFDQAVNVEKVFVDTGSNLAVNDWLKFGVLQANFESEKPRSTWSWPGTNAESCGDFVTVGSFVEGKANFTLTDSPKMKCLRIVVTQSQDEWLFLREIDVWEKT